MRIEVVGSGCTSCENLYKITRLAAERAGINDEQLMYVKGQEGMARIMELGAMSSPLLVVDGKVVMIGYTSNIEKVKELITQG
jgi:hypothetical protein